MPRFGASSTRKLDTLDERLQRVLALAIKDGPDFSIVCGHRSGADQMIAFHGGYSRLQAGESLHNSSPSRAVDICPYGGSDVWGDEIRFGLLAGWVMKCAAVSDVKLRWGGDWSRTWRANERSTFFDGGHFEIIED